MTKPHVYPEPDEHTYAPKDMAQICKALRARIDEQDKRIAELEAALRATMDALYDDDRDVAASILLATMRKKEPR